MKMNRIKGIKRRKKVRFMADILIIFCSLLSFILRSETIFLYVQFSNWLSRNLVFPLTFYAELLLIKNGIF